jgi:hypothetical protein
MSPQILGSVNNGDTISGLGFSTEIYSECQCTAGLNVTDIQAVDSDLDDAAAELLLQAYHDLKALGIANHIDFKDNSTIVSTLIYGTRVCGGMSGTYVPLCKTTFYEHRKAVVQIEYMTDGTTASIAPKTISVRAELGPAKISWLNAALLAILEGETNSISLPASVPSALSGLLWWATPNLLTIDPALIEGGIETMFTVLLRAGMQRTFSTHGSFCTRNVALSGKCIIQMKPYSVTIGVIIIIMHLIATIAGILAYVPWIISNTPFGPAIRLIKEKVYFTALVSSSSFNFGFSELCNSPTHSIWQVLDVHAVIGESIKTINDEAGHVVVDKPKLVRPLTNGRRYY